MAGDKVRVHELAKKLGLSSKEVIALLDKKLGVNVKSHASTVEQDVADKLLSADKPKAAPAPKKEEAPRVQQKELPKEKPQAAAPQKPAGKPAPRDSRPSGFDKPRFQGQRPEGQSGDRRPYQGNRQRFKPGQDGERRPYQGDRPRFQGPRPEGQGGERRPYQGDRPRFQGPRPEGQGGERRPYQGDRPRFQGPRPEGQGGERRPYQGDRPRFQGPRPEGQGGERRPYQGDRPRFQGPRPEGGAPRRPFNGDKPAPAPEKIEPGKTSTRKEPFNKKKDKFVKKDDFNQEDKILAKFQEKKKKQKQAVEEEKVTQVVINSPLTVGELSEKTKISSAELVKELMMSGVLATVNQTIDAETAKKVVEKFEITVLDKEEVKEVCDPETGICKTIDESKLVERAPVVTIMGHVDHGKTTLLDAIRASKHKIVNTEVGGITQSIGAYTVYNDDKKIVFIDTPGHEAFTAMRARGAQSTDIAILVVAADDGIMPQTIEAINHAKAAKVPIIIAVNKIDKPEADPDRVLQQLTEYDLVPEAWGGDTICVNVSAIQGTNLDELLEYITLISEVEELKADPEAAASGVIVEAELDKGKGPVATMLVQQGTLEVGDCVVVGNVGGKVRALISDSGERIKEAGPSTPVEILGLSEVPQAGDAFEVVACERDMKSLVEKRKDQERTTKLESLAPVQARRESIKQGQEETAELNIIIKADTHGSAEAVSASLQQLKSKQIFVNIVHVAVGDISEADVMLASASNSIIIGFSVKEDTNAQKCADKEGIDIRKYDIIYQILEDIEKTMLGLLQPEVKEVEIGTVEVRQVFTIGKTVKIAGCYVLEGKVIRNNIAAVIRDDKEVFKGKIDQLKRFKDDVKEVAKGFECGISFDKFNNIEEGDMIKVYAQEEIQRETLV